MLPSFFFQSFSLLPRVVCRSLLIPWSDPGDFDLRDPYHHHHPSFPFSPSSSWDGRSGKPTTYTIRPEENREWTIIKLDGQKNLKRSFWDRCPILVAMRVTHNITALRVRLFNDNNKTRPSHTDTHKPLSYAAPVGMHEGGKYENLIALFYGHKLLQPGDARRCEKGDWGKNSRGNEKLFYCKPHTLSLFLSLFLLGSEYSVHSKWHSLMGGLKDGRDVTVFGGALLSSERDRGAGKAHRHKENIIIFLLNYGFFSLGE